MFLNDTHAKHASHEEYAGDTNPTHTRSVYWWSLVSVDTWAPRITGIGLQEALW